MKHPAWLVELHRQWKKARGRRTTVAVRSFSRVWEDLLDEAGLHRAEERQAAERELEKLSHFKRHYQPLRRRLLKIELLVDGEAWLDGLFGTQSGGDAKEQALAVVRRHAGVAHPLLAELWAALCGKLEVEFLQPRVCGPFRWREAAGVDALLTLLFQVTAQEWAEGTLVRAASTRLGLESKELEEQQGAVERALELMFGRQMPLEALGIQTSNSVLYFSGPLTLHFADGKVHVSETLRSESTLSVTDLGRAVSITTTAERLLTVENRKTTFVQLARADERRTTLIVATSFPTPAVRLLLEKLSAGVPHYHFGDTDASGWDILRKLREVVPGREVLPFLMGWRAKEDARVLTVREKQIVLRLLGDPLMADCHEALRAMLESGMKGDFEQETLGAPELREWPFYC